MQTFGSISLCLAGDIAFFCPPNPLLFSPGLSQQFVDVARFTDSLQFSVEFSDRDLECYICHSSGCHAIDMKGDTMLMIGAGPAVSVCPQPGRPTPAVFATPISLLLVPTEHRAARMQRRLLGTSFTARNSAVAINWSLKR